MVKSKTLTLGCGILTIAGTLLFSQNVCAETDGFNTFETEKYYEKHANELTTEDWYEDYASKLPGLTEAQKISLKGLHYYLKLNPSVDLNEIKTHEDSSNPDNVNRVIRLMPEDDYEKMFPESLKGPCSYLNLLKAVAVLPGFCSDYKDFNKLTALEPTEEMADPDLVAKKILAAVMANAVQETSNSGQGPTPSLSQKIPGTFATIKEQEKPDYNTRHMGPFDADHKWENVAKGNIYSGRGVHQITYAVTYANISLILYGDLRLVKYPDLLTSDTLIPWLTTLVYFIMPQSQYPTIAEVFDGQWEKHLDSTGKPEEFINRYKKEFPVCVLLINGGIECGSVGKGQGASIANNTKIRGGAYYHFVNNFKIEGKTLFVDDSPIDSDAVPANEMLKQCYLISQTKGPNETVEGILNGLNWYRPFFLIYENSEIKPISYCVGEMPFTVFAGSNVAKLYQK